MDIPTKPETKSAFKSPFLYSSIVLLGLLVYVAYILYSRHKSTVEFERREQEQQLEKRREDDKRAVEQLGGSELAVRALYVSPAIIHRGESAQLCYDVTNAKTVALDPPVGDVWPSHSRCLNLSPKSTTTYTLSITDAQGNKVTKSVELRVR